ncbi:MAG TPA: type III-B CRISPR module RAMP protein Cmr6 [Blastocatellia bacterium]|nr:type III-B CRISPR module RAMP protein Cmr6 [Blastocatellia bacterium]
MPNGRRRARTGSQPTDGPPSPRFPLPRDSQALAEALRSHAQNVGLLFNKFVWIWDGNWTLEGKFKEGRRERSVKSWFLEQVESIARSFPRDAYFAFLERQVRMVASFEEHGYKTVIFGKRAEARILSGLGGAHPMEVGFAFHSLYGFPYLPGSGLKGVARAWAELTGEPADKIKLVFGSESKDERQAEEHQQGDVVFLDAYAIAPPRLEVDILNPHFPDYYRDPKNNLPTEWQSPNPVNFLTIGIGSRAEEKPVFQFALVARSDEALRLAREWLERGLEQLGFGGKTASGYGFFAEGRISAEELTKELAKLQKAESAKGPSQKASPVQASPPAPKPAPEKKSPSPASPEQQKTKAASKPPEPPARPRVKQGDKLEAEVLANDGRRVTVRLLGGLDQEVTFETAYYPHPPGKRVKVKVMAVTADEKVTKVSPA